MNQACKLVGHYIDQNDRKIGFIIDYASRAEAEGGLKTLQALMIKTEAEIKSTYFVNGYEFVGAELDVVKTLGSSRLGSERELCIRYIVERTGCQQKVAQNLVVQILAEYE